MWSHFNKMTDHSRMIRFRVTGGKGKIKMAIKVNKGVMMTTSNQYKIDRNHTMKQTPVGNRAELKTNQKSLRIAALIQGTITAIFKLRLA